MSHKRTAAPVETGASAVGLQNQNSATAGSSGQTCNTLKTLTCCRRWEPWCSLQGMGGLEVFEATTSSEDAGMSHTTELVSYIQVSCKYTSAGVDSIVCTWQRSSQITFCQTCFTTAPQLVSKLNCNVIFGVNSLTLDMQTDECCPSCQLASKSSEVDDNCLLGRSRGPSLCPMKTVNLWAWGRELMVKMRMTPKEPVENWEDPELEISTSRL